MDKIKILFLAANPQLDLNLDEEVRKIEEKLRMPQRRAPWNWSGLASRADPS